MESDFLKLTEWLENILQAGVAEENRFREWKRSDDSSRESPEIKPHGYAKAS